MQSQFGTIQVNDFSLNQDIFRIFRVSQRISKCLLEYLNQTDQTFSVSPNGFGGPIKNRKNYETFINSTMLHKCITTRLWHDSPHIFKQFSRIGTTLSQALVNQNITSFKEILKLDAHQLEAILNKNQPFGNVVLETVKKLPEYNIEFETIKHGTIDIICKMVNYENIAKYEDGGCLGYNTPIMLIVGDEKNNLLCAHRLKYLIIKFILLI